MTGDELEGTLYMGNPPAAGDYTVYTTGDAPRLATPFASTDPRVVEQAARLQERFDAIIRRGPPRIALVEEALGDEIVAKVAVMPGSPEPRVVIVSRQGLDDEVLARGRGVLGMWEHFKYPALEKAVLTLYRDGRIQVETDTGIKNYREQFHGMFRDRMLQTRGLLDASAEVAEVDHPIAGRARLLDQFQERGKPEPIRGRKDEPDKR